MNLFSSNRFSIAALVCIASINIACTSVPTTQYYTLVAGNTLLVDANSSTTEKRSPLLDTNNSIGIGPLVIPNSLENFSVLSITNNNNIVINPYHLWAGNLKANINQVMADNISRSLNVDSVWAFPWDNRNRPNIQVRVVFEEFMGERGKSVTLQTKWTLLVDYGKTEIKTEKTVITEPLLTESYLGYVQALNLALNKFSLIVATELDQLDEK